MPQWPPTDYSAVGAELNPPSNAQRARDPQVQWTREYVAEPYPWIPKAPNIGTQTRRFVVEVQNQPVGGEIIASIQIDIPGTAYALSGAAVDTAAPPVALPVGYDPLDMFLVRFEHSSGDRLDTQAGIASSLIGKGDKPALIGGPGWTFDRGSTLRVGITPLRLTMRITVVAWMIETRGPTNLGALG